MANIALIACTKSKSNAASPAALLYTSPLFKKSLLYAIEKADQIYILSAKHGLLRLDQTVEPYELSMKDLTPTQKREWAEKVSAQLADIIKPRDQVHLLAGLEYSKPLEAIFQKTRCQLASPLSGMSLGHRISWLKKSNEETELFSQYNSFYSAIRDLYVGQSGGRTLSECTGKMDWPARGVYFFLEPGERLEGNKRRPLSNRVVRIGTHGVSRGSKATLWNRISTHRGTTSGGGNHRSSIFRLHVGAAMIRRDLHKWQTSHWGIGQSSTPDIQKSETLLESEVSSMLGQMKVLWLNVPDDPSPQSDRAYIERNAIGLLSRMAILTGGQSPQWLGRWSRQIRITTSGLWNLDHLFSRPDKHFPDVLSKYVAITLGKLDAPTEPLAPVAWYAPKQRSDSPQLSLFANDPPTTTSRRR